MLLKIILSSEKCNCNRLFNALMISFNAFYFDFTYYLPINNIYLNIKSSRLKVISDN